MPIARELTNLWGRMIDAPLEKILDDDCSVQAYDLLRRLNEASVLPSKLDVMAAIRAVAASLDLKPPDGSALRIYFKVLGAIPRTPLFAATETLIEKHLYQSFPKPGHWLALASEDARLIERARFMMTLYENRRKIAELRYRPSRSGLRKPATDKPAQTPQVHVNRRAPGEFDLE